MRKFLPKSYYWFFFAVILTATILALEIIKNNYIKYSEIDFRNKFENRYNEKILEYKNLASFIFLNNIKFYNSFLNIENIESNRYSEELLKSEYTLDKSNNYLSFYFKDISNKNIVKVNFNLEDFLNKFTNDNFSVKINVEKKLLEDIKIDSKNNVTYFKRNNQKYIAIYYVTNKERLLVYKNIDNSFITDIGNKFIYIYIFIFLVYLTLMFLIYNINVKNTLSKVYEHKFNEIRDSINKYIIMLKIDTNGLITDVTQSFCDWSYYSKNELIGEKFTKLIHDDVSEKFYERIKIHLLSNPSWEGEFKNKDKYGNSLWSKGVIYPLFDEANNSIGYSMILVDISDNRQMKKINTLLKEELSNKLNEMKIKEDDFKDKTKVQLMSRILDSISHQWKEPIGNISIELTKFSIDLIQKNLQDKNLLKIHQNIDNELKNLSISLNSYKSLFVKNNLNDKYNVYSIIKDAISLCSNEITEYNIKIDLNSEKEIYCFGISLEIRQIILSFLKFSIQQIKLREIQGANIDFTVIQDNNDVLIRYTDNSQNFDENIIREVLEDSNDDRIGKDLNIHLHIAKLLVKKTGSKIWFENEDTQTIFYLKLISQDRRKVKDRL